MIKALTASVVMAAAVMGASASQAAILVSDFTVDRATGGLGVSAPYGEVVVNDAGGKLAFAVTLFDNLRFRYAPDSNHWSFGFNLSNPSGISVSGVTDNGSVGSFSFINHSVTQSGFGTFQLAMDCDTGCDTSWNSNSPSVLNFTVAGPSALTVNDLTRNVSSYYFASDVTNTIGGTGNIGASSITITAVPEPATWAIMLMGFGGLGAMLRQRRQQVALVRA
ncbi:MAG TPA: PEPxxWA-CTERM sorting domain-containing protein [Phenylobacterium sp.]|uniref:PEPxxWA-CTERM sorting domain-containing protein n=1 Tax=Phenylobacterium sp. TaxID=1871053 RepID=UPI002B4803DB|nr:PEPxxWA-CTERM sorting domain-containing protein [Phenylobacterium sp.]HKR89425.1 PEPxxWA-CTERM sorting domain-containing protein [Phenylobacterium sp.]